jgi:hypothetical protein
MDDFQEFRQFLDFVHNHRIAIARTVDHIAKALGAGSQLSQSRGIQ